MYTCWSAPKNSMKVILQVFVVFIVFMQSRALRYLTFRHGILAVRKLWCKSTSIDANLGEQILVRSGSFAEDKALEILQFQLPNLRIVDIKSYQSSLRWLQLRNGQQIDSLTLEAHFLGKQKLSHDETASLWHKAISDRQDFSSKACNVGEGGALQQELNLALRLVQRCAYLTRSYQRLTSSTSYSKLNKADTSPVTIADYAVQAVLLSALHKRFPADLFIAEEDAAPLRSSPLLTQQVLHLVEAAVGEKWTPDQLFDALDLGQYAVESGVERGQEEGKVRGARREGGEKGQERGKRVWVLDPIDGTKGFIRREHYCIALGLLQDSLPVLSLLGCPNLSLSRVMGGGKGGEIVDIEQGLPLPLFPSPTPSFPLLSPDAGCVMFAVTGGGVAGAFVRGLEMPYGTAYEVQSSPLSLPNSLKLCESTEATKGSRVITSRLADKLSLSASTPSLSPFIHADGMCKQGLVGAGAVEGTLRLPPRGYREKIWDHVAGTHFVQAAGGVVTDLQGRPLDFSEGRCLREEVRGVVSAGNEGAHQLLLNTLKEVMSELGET